VNWREPIKHRLRAEAIRANCVVTPRRYGDMESAHVATRRMLTVKPVGERSAGNSHAAFDERGRETRSSETAVAPLLDSTGGWRA
jgi:hypothetical protein